MLPNQTLADPPSVDKGLLTMSPYSVVVADQHDRTRCVVGYVVADRITEESAQPTLGGRADHEHVCLHFRGHSHDGYARLFIVRNQTNLRPGPEHRGGAIEGGLPFGFCPFPILVRLLVSDIGTLYAPASLMGSSYSGMTATSTT